MGWETLEWIKGSMAMSEWRCDGSSGHADPCGASDGSLIGPGVPSAGADLTTVVGLARPASIVLFPEWHPVLGASECGSVPLPPRPRCGVAGAPLWVLTARVFIVAYRLFGEKQR